MIVGVPKEIYPGERRVALVPAVVPSLVKAGMEVLVESGAGVQSGYPDDAYAAKGARISGGRDEVFGRADVVLQVLCHGANDVSGAEDLPRMRPGQAVIGFLRPLASPRAVRELAERGVTSIAVELVPRTSRAQAMDVLSAMATIAGYKAVLLAAETLPRMFPMLMTAAGTISPAHVLVIGAGVAGLQAIGTARRLGAVASAYDLRPAAQEQIRSVGGRVVELPIDTADAEGAGGYAKAQGEDFYRRQRELLGAVVAESDVVITTAAVPGAKAPVLVTADMVERMTPGSVIVDLAAERGGNCELTRRNEKVERHGVTIFGLVNLPGTVPFHASQLYARAAANFLLHLAPQGTFDLERDDDIVREPIVTRGGEVVHPRVLETLATEA